MKLFRECRRLCTGWWWWMMCRWYVSCLVRTWMNVMYIKCTLNVHRLWSVSPVQFVSTVSCDKSICLLMRVITCMKRIRASETVLDMLHGTWYVSTSSRFKLRTRIWTYGQTRGYWFVTVPAVNRHCSEEQWCHVTVNFEVSAVYKSRPTYIDYFRTTFTTNTWDVL